MKYLYNAAKGNLKSQEKAVKAIEEGLKELQGLSSTVRELDEAIKKSNVSIGGSFSALYKQAVGTIKTKLQEEKELLKYIQDEAKK